MMAANALSIVSLQAATRARLLYQILEHNSDTQMYVDAAFLVTCPSVYYGDDDYRCRHVYVIPWQHLVLQTL